MTTRSKLFVWVVAGMLLAATGVGPGQQSAQATAPSESPVSAGATIPYTGSLTDEAGQPVADGAYSFTFDLYAAQTGGGLLWTETQPGVPVRGGSFAAVLGAVNSVPAGLLTGGEQWLAVSVRGPGEDAFTALTPRQLLAPTTAPAGVSPAVGAACPPRPSGGHVDLGNQHSQWSAADRRRTLGEWAPQSQQQQQWSQCVGRQHWWWQCRAW
jgi:hypothetical protein